MPSPSRSLRLLLAALVVIIATGLLLTLLSAADATLSIWQRLQRLPVWLAVLTGGLFALVIGSSGWLLFKLLRPNAVAKRELQPVTRETVEKRLASLQQHAPATIGEALAPLAGELAELDRRAVSGESYLAVFGEISAGKSSLLNALAGEHSRPADVRGGTTTEVSLSQIELPGIGPMVCADVPGANEWLGEARAVATRTEALRAHVVLYVCDGDLTAAQLDELKWLQGFGKPLLLVLNKVDRYNTAERKALVERLKTRSQLEVVEVSAGGTERVVVERSDGQRQTVERARAPQLDSLTSALERLLHAQSMATLEQRRSSAVLQGLDLQLNAAEARQRRLQAEKTVSEYSRKAVIGGLAAVAPGTDLLIQGVLGSQLVRELCALYGRKLKEVDADDLVKLAGGRLRGSSALVLAIAGNAAKAFPGLGTLGGGLLHAVAYGMIFASLGRALIGALEAGELKRDDVLERFQQGMTDQALLRRLAPQLLQLALKEWRQPGPHK